MQVSTLLLLTCIGASVLVARSAQKQDENLELRWQKMKARMLRKASTIGADRTPSGVRVGCQV